MQLARHPQQQRTPPMPLPDDLASAEPLTTNLPGDRRPVHERFEAQARRTPDALAVLAAPDTTISYRLLNERTNRLALHLRKAGVGRDALVAICMEQGVELVISLLAVLKAGGAYVPIDPNNPDERIHYILSDTSTRLLLTTSSLSGRWAHMGVEPVCVDDPAIAEFGPHNDHKTAQAPVQMDQLAYCIYTSGSTGVPKGALNLHRGLGNLVDWYVRDAGMSATDRVMVASSIGFDLTQKNIIAPLCVGACVLLPRCSPADAAGFLKALSTLRPTWINCAPSTFRTFAESPRTSSIRTVVLGGETVDEALVSSLKGRDLRLLNSYGPTECSDVAIWLQWQMNTPLPSGNMPIGRPIANVDIYLLDDALNPVPVGETGEICIGGVGVGRGYLGQLEKTADRFVVNPQDPKGSVIYRTGDLGKMLANTNLDFIGRRDFQVKVRGHRIELGEIESRLLEDPSVAAAAVCAFDAAPGDTRLVAYVVAKSGSADATSDALSKKLRTHLPDYMIPCSWVAMESLPINLSGKIDRPSLPRPTWVR
jgi:amino acid adenylation domain-containing protein